MKLRYSLLALVLACAVAPSALAQTGGASAGLLQRNTGGMVAGPPRASSRAAAYQAGVAALNEQNYTEAVRQLRTALRAAPEDGIINFALGLAYVGAGETGDAQVAFERSVRASNKPPGAHLQLGLLYLRANDREHAVEQQTALRDVIGACDARCGDQQRAQLQGAYDQLTAAIDAAPVADPATD